MYQLNYGFEYLGLGHVVLAKSKYADNKSSAYLRGTWLKTKKYQTVILVSLRYPGFAVRVRVVSSCLLVFTDVCNSIILFLFSCNRQ
jgi:hypothetical protein